jgi:hypothetical protein
MMIGAEALGSNEGENARRAVQFGRLSQLLMLLLRVLPKQSETLETLMARSIDEAFESFAREFRR